MRLVAALAVVVALSPPAAGGEGHLWNGFDYRWTKHPHRLSLLSSRIEGSQLIQELKIGSFPADEATYRAWIVRVASRRLAIGRAVTRSVEIRGTIDRVATQTVDAFIRMPGLAGFDMPVARVFLGGFRIEATNFSSGWHFGALGVKVTRAWIERAALRARLRVTVKPSNSPDPINGFDYLGNWKRKEPCIYRFHAVVVGVAGQARHVAFTDGREDFATRKYVRSAVLERRVTVRTGSRGRSWRAFGGLRGFRVTIGTRTKAPGRYIRRLAARISGVAYSSGRGALSLSALAGFSNESTIPYKWQLDARLAYTLVQVDDPGLKVASRMISGSLDRNQKRGAHPLESGGPNR